MDRSSPDEGSRVGIEGTIYEPSTIIEPERLSLSAGSRIDSFTLINCTGGVRIADESVVHAGSRVVGSGGLSIGSRCAVTYNCVLITSYPDPRGQMSSMVPKEEVVQHTGKIVLEDETFVGSNAVIMPGVTVHERAVVGAGCYVDEDVPPGEILYPDGTRDERPGGRG